MSIEPSVLHMRIGVLSPPTVLYVVVSHGWWPHPKSGREYYHMTRKEAREHIRDLVKNAPRDMKDICRTMNAMVGRRRNAPRYWVEKVTLAWGGK